MSYESPTKKNNKSYVYVTDRQAGLTYREIAEKYGVSYQTVAQGCARRGVGHFKPYTAAEVVYPNLRKWLNENKVSRYEFIRRMGEQTCAATSSKISVYFRGKAYPRKITIDKFIAVTGLTYEQLFAEEECGWAEA